MRHHRTGLGVTCLLLFGAGLVVGACFGSRALAASTPGITSVQIVSPPSEVAKYAKLELLVMLSDVSATKYCNPDPAQGGLDLSATFTSPTGLRWTVNGFYDGVNWLIRFAPNQTGAWQFAVTARDSGGVANWTGGTFTCVASANRGWPRLSGHYLRFAEGAPLIAVGHNTGWQYDVEQPALAAMASKGENLLSFWMAVPWAKPSWASQTEPWWDDRAPIENIEEGIGNYNQAACAYIDGVVARAETAGVYLLPTVWSHGQLRDSLPGAWGAGWWANNAYSSVCAVGDFFKMSEGSGDTPQWRYQKNYYRYLLARWGYSPAIAGWVAMCEIDGTNGFSKNRTQAEGWSLSVRDYFRANDLFRRNAAGDSPVTFFKTNDPTWMTGFDLRSTDSYTSATNNIAVAATLASQTATMWASGQACLHGEFGGDTINGASQPAHLHNGTWAGLTAGATMTPLVWCDGGNFPMLTPAMQNHLQFLSQFVNSIDYMGDASLGPASLALNSSTCRGWGLKLSDRGFAWIQNTAGTMKGQTLTVSGMATGTYGVYWYDTWTSGSTPISSATVTVGKNGSLKAVIPTLAQPDIACKFLRNPPPANRAPVAVGDSYTVQQGNTLNVAAPGVLANDSDTDGDTITAILVTKPAQGELAAFNGNGSFSYVAPASGVTGTDNFTYKANDGQLDSEVATVSITVTPPASRVYGWVTDPSSNGIPRISIRLDRQSGGRWIQMGKTTTDASGYYAFDSVPTSSSGVTYRITPLTKGFDYNPKEGLVTLTSAAPQAECSFVATAK